MCFVFPLELCYSVNMNMFTITIPKNAMRGKELVAIPRKQLEALIERAGNEVGEKDILRWSREARALKRSGKLPVLRSLRSL